VIARARRAACRAADDTSGDVGLGVWRAVATGMLASLCVACSAPALVPAAPAPPRSFVVLEASLDGSTGAVIVRGPQGTTVLDRRLQAAALDGSSSAPFQIPTDQLAREFAGALSARPAAAEVFRLYFETGRATLTPASERLIEEILEAVRQRPPADVSIIGHTDTEGDEAANERLGLERARWIAALLKRRGLSAAEVTIASHGERDLLVRTSDNTSEVRNRRVEVIVR